AFNLTVESLYITQSVQKPNGAIPLVAGRDGYLRVFAVANNINDVRVPLEVSLYHEEDLKNTWTIRGPAAIPRDIVEGNLSTSWNLLVPGELIQPGLRIEIAIDPEEEVREGDESDNRLPEGFAVFDVRRLPPLEIVLVPIKQPDGTVGNVTDANAHEYLRDLERMFPVHEIDVRVREPVLAGSQLRPDGGWESMLEQLAAIRRSEGATNAYYYGVAALDYEDSIQGIAFIAGKSGLGNDFLDDRNLNASMTLAHEMGHSMGRLHSFCGAVRAFDNNYPHANGQIGSFGLDVNTEKVYQPTTKDLMGYCADRWIGDYTYEKILQFRLDDEATSGDPERVLIVWGGIGADGLTLEPAFESEAAPALPEVVGPYHLEGFDASGVRLFSIPFRPTPIADGAPGNGAFAFALPMRLVQPERLAELRISGLGMESRNVAPRMPGVSEPAITTERKGDRVIVRWDAQAHPLLVLRNPQSGRIVSLLRGGSAELPYDGRALEVTPSDGVRSHRPAAIIR
ncbi:MAG: hypothetical protein WD737_04350, partial [Gemmatimonadota bacterium]